MRDNAVWLLMDAAQEILEYVDDPGDPPSSPLTRTLEYRVPKSPAQVAREQADRLEAQSRAVLRLKAALAAVRADAPPAQATAAEEVDR